MARVSCSIKPLPLEVQGLVQSSIAITSLNDVVLELLKNSFDAQPTTVEIEIDFRRGFCMVTDNGLGIPHDEFGEDGKLGLMHCTSKHQSSTCYGRHGRFLACLSTLSILSITSQHGQNPKEANIILHRGNVISRSISGQENNQVLRGYHGTKVVVRNLFGDLPVRVKHRISQFENDNEVKRQFTNLKRQVVGLLLACSIPLDLTISEVGAKLKFVSLAATNQERERASSFDIGYICKIFTRATYISAGDSDSWKTVSARTSLLQIRAAISTEPAPSKRVQFISIGNKPLDQTRGVSLLFDEVNSTFELSSFGSSEDDLDHSEDALRRQRGCQHQLDSHTFRQSRSSRKRVDRWPMFYIRIDRKSSHIAESINNVMEENESKNLRFRQVTNLLNSLIQQFLVAYGFRPYSQRRGGVQLNDQENWDERELWTKGKGSRIQNDTMRIRTASHGFSNWPRVKTGFKASFSINPVERVATSLDLPGSNQCLAAKEYLGQCAIKSDDVRTGSNDDWQLLLDNLSDDLSGDESRPQSSDQELRVLENVCHTNLTPLTPADDGELQLAEEIVLWRNPRNGMTYKIDARTGNVVHKSVEPLEPAQVNALLDNASDSIDKRTSHTGQDIRDRDKKLSISALAAFKMKLGHSVQGYNHLSFRTPEERIQSVVEIGNNDFGPQCSKVHKTLSRFFEESMRYDHDLRLRREDLTSAIVLGQVDQKYILIRLPYAKVIETEGQLEDATEEVDGLLVLIDQHAADERIKVEQLYQEFSQNSTVTLTKPIIFELTMEEVTMFELQVQFFRKWNIVYEIRSGMIPSSLRTSVHAAHKPNPQNARHIAVLALPTLIAERSRVQPKTLIDLLRKEIWSDDRKSLSSNQTPNNQSSINATKTIHSSDWTSKLASCPKGILEMLNSRACRSAIMFNDVLTGGECAELVKELARCRFPFMCAHGRPSMVVLSNLDVLDKSLNGDKISGEAREQIGNFATAWKRWNGGKTPS